MPARPAEPHQAREMAESFGADPGRYDRTRPGYPKALIERIVAALPGRDVLDVGMGTGIVARQLGSAGCRVLGVEVDARMAEWARERGLAVEVAAFEGWDPVGRTFDAVVSGQSWHWVEPVAGAAKAAEALRPGGRLALFWNVFAPPPDVAEAFAAVYRRVLPDMPIFHNPRPPLDAYSGILGRAAGGIRAAGAFAEPEEWRTEWERTYTREAWLELVPTQGGMSRLPPDRRAALLEGLGAAIDGAFTGRYTTVALLAVRDRG